MKLQSVGEKLTLTHAKAAKLAINVEIWARRAFLPRLSKTKKAWSRRHMHDVYSSRRDVSWWNFTATYLSLNHRSDCKWNFSEIASTEISARWNFRSWLDFGLTWNVREHRSRRGKSHKNKVFGARRGSKLVRIGYIKGWPQCKTQCKIHSAYRVLAGATASKLDDSVKVGQCLLTCSGAHTELSGQWSP